jgi:hypothetical protein
MMSTHVTPYLQLHRKRYDNFWQCKHYSVSTSEWACLVTETCPEFESLPANIMAETSKRMHISDEVLCVLQDNELSH